MGKKRIIAETGAGQHGVATVRPHHARRAWRYARCWPRLAARVQGMVAAMQIEAALRRGYRGCLLPLAAKWPALAHHA